MTNPVSGGVPEPQTNDGRWSDERLACASNEDVVELFAQLRWRVAHGGEQGGEMDRMHAEIMRRMGGGVPEQGLPGDAQRDREVVAARLGAILCRKYARQCTGEFQPCPTHNDDAWEMLRALERDAVRVVLVRP